MNGGNEKNKNGNCQTLKMCLATLVQVSQGSDGILGHMPQEGNQLSLEHVKL